MVITHDDGRRKMPKLKCPYGNHRFADVSTASLRNNCQLIKLHETENPQFVLECPICHQKAALIIRTLPHDVGANSAPVAL